MDVIIIIVVVVYNVMRRNLLKQRNTAGKFIAINFKYDN